MDEQPNEHGEGGPKFFKSVNGWIAGATGLVVALGGLTAAYRELVHKDPVAAQTVANTAVSNDSSADQQATSTQASDDPWGYTTDNGGSLRYKGGYWLETDADGTEARYTPQSVENGITFARNSGGGADGGDVDLRWPTAGGQAEKSTDKQVTWNDAYVVAPESGADAN